MGGRDGDRHSHRRLQTMLDREPDEIEDYYRRKYADKSESYGFRGDQGDLELDDDIAQQTHQPSVKDPMLWMVRCRLGEEKATALQMMRKFIAYQNTDQPLQIRSVVAPENVKGYVYIEAFKQTHVKAAIEGIGNLKMGSYEQKMVPIKEMTEVLRVTKQQAVLARGQWVRLKRGVFKDDLAQVYHVEQAQNRVELKMIPRIDYTKLRGAFKNNADAEKKRKFKKPPQKLFDVDAIRRVGGDVSTDGDFLIFEGNRFSRKGYLFKAFTMSAILTEGIKPTLEELQKFDAQPENLEMDLGERAGGIESGELFAPGDNVIVCDGELVNLQGKVITVDGNKVSILPKHDDLNEPLEFQTNELKKFFKPGDHVKVLNGRFEGDTGMILRVENELAILLSDVTCHELKVRTKDLQLCADTATGVDAYGQYQWGDLVQLDPQTVGVIVRLEKEHFQVLAQTGNVRSVKHQTITRKCDSKKAVALDSEQNEIHVKDVVRVTDGPHSGRTGEVRHIFRIHAFLHSRFMTDNGGIFVCKTRHLTLAGNKVRT
ncbi:transcription elongation factor SPT5-like, partial [Tropilaelaps mercedesae]